MPCRRRQGERAGPPLGSLERGLSPDSMPILIGPGGQGAGLWQGRWSLSQVRAQPLCLQGQAERAG